MSSDPRRNEALDQAVRLLGTGADPTAVVEAADIFYRFITGSYSATQIVMNVTSPDLSPDEIARAIRKVMARETRGRGGRNA